MSPRVGRPTTTRAHSYFSSDSNSSESEDGCEDQSIGEGGQELEDRTSGADGEPNFFSVDSVMQQNSDESGGISRGDQVETADAAMEGRKLRFCSLADLEDGIEGYGSSFDRREDSYVSEPASGVATERSQSVSYNRDMMLNLPHLKEDDYSIPLVNTHARFGEISVQKLIDFWKKSSDAAFVYAKAGIVSAANYVAPELLTAREANAAMKEHSEAVARLYFHYAKRVQRFVVQTGSDILNKAKKQRVKLEGKHKALRQQLRQKRKRLKAKQSQFKSVVKDLNSSEAAVEAHTRGLKNSLNISKDIDRGIVERFRGFLFKKGGGGRKFGMGRRNWKERLFILGDTDLKAGCAHLHYYRNPKDVNPRGTVLIDAKTTVKELELEGKHHAFQISSKALKDGSRSQVREGKMHYALLVQAPCAEDRIAWINTIRSTVKLIEQNQDTKLANYKANLSRVTGSPQLSQSNLDESNGSGASDTEAKLKRDSDDVPPGLILSSESGEAVPRLSEQPSTHRRNKSSMKDHKLVSLELRVKKNRENLHDARRAVLTSEEILEGERREYKEAISGLLSEYEAVECTRLQLTKALYLDAIEAEKELNVHRLKLLADLEKKIRAMDARSDLDYFVRANRVVGSRWSKISGNVPVISRGIAQNRDEVFKIASIPKKKRRSSLQPRKITLNLRRLSTGSQNSGLQADLKSSGGSPLAKKSFKIRRASSFDPNMSEERLSSLGNPFDDDGVQKDNPLNAVDPRHPSSSNSHADSVEEYTWEGLLQ